MINTVAFPGLFDKVLTLNRVAFTVFGRDIMWYGVIIATGFALAAFYAVRRAKDFELDTDFILDLLIVGLPAAILGARIYYVMHKWSYYSQNPSEILHISGGGLGFYGGFIGALLAGYILCRIKKRHVLPILDVTGIGFILAQSIGRWGNFVNCEAFGTVTDLPWGMSINGGAPVHPTFLYESLWNMAGFIFLHFYSKKKQHFNGEIFLMYMGWYGLGRAMIEGLRTDSLYIIGTNIRVSQLVAAISFVVCTGLWIYLLKTKKYTPKNKGGSSVMKALTMFVLPECPHCELALKLNDELKNENPQYAAIDINVVDESAHPEISEKYDYYYVPCYFAGDEKLHEGHAEKEDVEKVFKAVLEK